MQQEDILRIKREAKTLKRREGRFSYMQYLDEAARRLYGVRHYHEALARSRRAKTAIEPASPMQHYLRAVQEYYLAI